MQLLAEHADFHVNINSVVGGGVKNPQDALTIGQRALELGFSSTIGIIHDGSGQLQPLVDDERAVYHEMKAMEKRSFTRINEFQDNIAAGPARTSGAAAPARATSTSAKTAWCTTARSSAAIPAVPLANYTVADIRREYVTEKGCAPHCTVSCVHQVSIFDSWRAPQQPRPAGTNGLVQIG